MDAAINLAGILAKEVLNGSSESFFALFRKIRLKNSKRFVACFVLGGILTIVPLLLYKKICRKSRTKKPSRNWQNRELKFNEKPKGIVNLGNTCYLNSLLQVVSWTPQMGQQLFLCKQYIGNESDITDSIACCLMELIDCAHSDNASSTVAKMMHILCREPKIDIAVPNKILCKIRELNPQFLGHDQQDSFEAFNTIIGGIEDELQDIRRRKENQAGDTSNITSELPVAMLLGGMFMTVYRYQTCGHVETTFQRFTSISVPVPKKRLEMHGYRPFRQQMESHNVMPKHKNADFSAKETEQVVEKSKAVSSLAAVFHKDDRMSSQTQAERSGSNVIASTTLDMHVENDVDEENRNHSQNTENTEQKENFNSTAISNNYEPGQTRATEESLETEIVKPFDNEDVSNENDNSSANSSYLSQANAKNNTDRDYQPVSVFRHDESEKNERATAVDDTLSTQHNLLQLDDTNRFHATKDTDRNQSLETPACDKSIKEIPEVKYINTLDSAPDQTSLGVLDLGEVSDQSTDGNEDGITNEDSRKLVSGDQVSAMDQRHSDDEDTLEIEFKNNLGFLENESLRELDEEYDKRIYEESNASAADSMGSIVIVQKTDFPDNGVYNKTCKKELTKLKTEVEFVNNLNLESSSPYITIAHTDLCGANDDVLNTEWGKLENKIPEVEQAEVTPEPGANAVDDDVRSPENRDCKLMEQAKLMTEPGVNALKDEVDSSENSNSCPIDPVISEYMKKKQHENNTNPCDEIQKQSSKDVEEDCQPNTAPNDYPEQSSCFMTLQGPTDECATDVERGLMELTDIEHFEEEVLQCRICNTEGHKKTQKKLSVISVPPVLVLQINKFKQEYGQLQKLDQDVSYPKYLNLSTVCSLAMEVKDLGSSIPDDGVWYHLYGVVSHAGTLKNGHYTAYVRTSQEPHKLYESFLSKKWTNPESCRKSIETFLKEKSAPVEQKKLLIDDRDTWYHISDTWVSQCKEEQALKDRNAAILLYERIL